MVKFVDQPDSWQCPSCQGLKSGFIDVDENTTATPPPLVFQPEPAAPEMMSSLNGRDGFNDHETVGWAEGPAGQKLRASPSGECSPSLTRRTVKELTKEDPWLKYTKGRKLGGGAYGSVHQAVCKATGEDVAIKSIVGSKMTDKMKKREIDTMLNCHCKYLIETHDAFEWRGTLYIIMDLVKARTDEILFGRKGEGVGGNPDIFAWLTEDHGIGGNNERPPTLQESATIIHHIAAAIHYLNQPPLSAIHRDLKPENVLVGPEGIEKLKVCDFGLARLDIVSNLETVTCTGTAGYMAPELLSGRMGSQVKVGSEPFKVDIFSLGILAYISFVKYHPFENTNAKILANEWSQCNGPVWQHVPNGAKQLVRGMLQHKPEDRYSIEQVLADQWLQANATVEAEESLPAEEEH